MCHGGPSADSPRFRGVFEDVTHEGGGDSAFFDPARRRSLGWQRLSSLWVRVLRALVWRRLPRTVRQAALRILLTRNRRPVATGAPAAEPVAVVGLLSTPTGIGEGGRLTGRALAALGYDVLSIDVSDIFRGTAPAGDPPPALEIGRGTVILHFNPDNLAAMLTLLGRRRLRGKRIVGYWAWELPRIPDHWLPALDEVDEVWTPSRFVADAVRPFTEKPVRVVPHPVAQGQAGRRRRDAFGLGGAFTALAMFSFASSYPRKNPLAAVRAFRLAFGDAEDRLLILKVADAEQSPEEMAELRAEIGEARNIRIEDRRLGDRERLDLVASADVLLSLHRSEGFGLVMAEAMLAGVPVIATAWSGNMDFMDGTSAWLVPFRFVSASDNRGVYDSGECWADPDVEAAAAHLRAVAAGGPEVEAIREAGRLTALERLGVRGFGEAVAPVFAPAAGKPRRRPASSPPAAAPALRSAA